jgi:hypothetical protein
MASTNYGTYGGRSIMSEESGRDERRPGSGPSSCHSVRRSGSFDHEAHAARLRNRINVWELIFVPWAVLVLILLCYLLGGAHGQIWVLWLVPVLLMGIFIAFVCWHYKAGKNAEVLLGLLSIIAVIIGLVVGVYAVMTSLLEYHRLNGGASYFNVLPTEPAAAKSDATTILFTNFTSIQFNRTYGFVDALTTSHRMGRPFASLLNPGATTYCVAPIASGLRENSRVQYWAAGLNCCEQRSNFQCGDANFRGTHGAIVLPRSLQTLQGYEAAIHGAESAYGLEISDTFMLLAWTEDPIGYRNRLWSSTANLFVIFGFVYLAISSIIGCGLMPHIATKSV